MSQVAHSGAPTPRRSARLSQAGSVTGQSVLTAVTTGGTRQRKKGPLTKVKARKSNAYGASGRVGAAEELSISATGFAQAFQSQRGDAVAREDEEEDDIDELGTETPRMSGALNGFAFQHSPLANHGQDLPSISSHDGDEINPSDSGLDTSIGNTSKSFGMGHEAGMLPQTSGHSPTRRPSDDFESSLPLWQRNAVQRARRLVQRSAQAAEEEEAEIQPVLQQRQAESVVSKQKVYKLSAEAQSSKQPNDATRPDAQSRSQANPRQLNNPLAVNQWLGNVETDQKKTAGESQRKRAFMWIIWLIVGFAVFSLVWTTLHSDTTHGTHLGDSVTSLVSRSRQQVGQWILPKNARRWDTVLSGSGLNDKPLQAGVQELYAHVDDRLGDMQDVIMSLKKDLPDIMVVRNTKGRREITDEFWQALMSKATSSSAEWDHFVRSNAEKIRSIIGVPRTVNDVNSGPVAVSREEFIKMIEDQYKKLAAQIDKRILDAIEAQAPQIQAMGRAEARKAVLDSIRQQSLAQGNLQANYEVNLLKPNFFAPGLGAMVDPFLTSATFTNEVGFLPKFGRRMALGARRNPPVAALTKWEEPGDCWCPARDPSMKGQSQLAVSLVHPVFPTQVTIEHIPMSMVPGRKIANAPRHLEFWVETEAPVRHVYASRKEGCKDGPKGWTCLGSFKYNIHASNHVQTFDLDAESSVPIRRAMIRVLSNWGSEYTCLYRVRLHGKAAGEDHQYNVVLNDPDD